jgi:hypothetical protein
MKAELSMLDKTHPSLFAFALTRCVSTELDRVGDVVACRRLCASEADHAFGLRLAIHIQQSIFDREQLLEMVLSLAQPTSHGITKRVRS